MKSTAYTQIYKCTSVDYPSDEFIVKKINTLKLSQDEISDYILQTNLIQKLKNPNIVKVYDIYKDEQFLFIVTEFLEEGHLFQKLTTDNYKFGENQVAEIIQRILCAIKAYR